MQNIQILKYNLFKDSATLHVTCVIHVLNFIVHKEFSCTSWSECLVHMGLKKSSAHGSQMKFKVLCTPLSGLVHMGCTLCQVFLWLICKYI